MCVAIVVLLVSETSFLLMNIYRVTCKSHVRCVKKNCFVQFLPKFELLDIFELSLMSDFKKWLSNSWS